MILDASILSGYQQCKRKHALASQFRSRRWRPRLLFEHWLRYGIRALSNGAALLPTVAHCKASLLSACANPGLDTSANPYSQAKDWAAAIDTVLHAASRLTLLTIRDIPPVPLTPDLHWRLTSPVDDSGTLHRWIAVSRWDEDELSRAAHGWWVFGDMCALRANLMLHVVEVGQLRGKQRRDSVWTRAYRHPTIPHLPLMFRKSDGSEAFGGRIPAYLADLPQQDVASWVDQLYSCGLAKEKMRHVTLACPSDAVCADTVRQIIQEAGAMAESMKHRTMTSLQAPTEAYPTTSLHTAADHANMDYARFPMSHSACDGNPPCPFQPICYHPAYLSPAEILDTGLYDLRNPLTPAQVLAASVSAPASEPASIPSHPEPHQSHTA